MTTEELKAKRKEYGHHYYMEHKDKFHRYYVDKDKQKTVWEKIKGMI